MSAEAERRRFTQIESLFAQALELDAQGRDRLLAGLSEPTLRAELSRLLAAHASARGFLEQLDVEKATTLLQRDAPHLAEQRIGPYRVVRELGRGGMGVVYLAERADGNFEQRVALKLLRRGLDHQQLLQSFLHERQILARLEHQHIARLLDGGSDAEGRPWFAMEYVEGEPMTSYCRRLQLPTRARLQLLLDACEAVRHAHQNLVVHRDLKPSNILVDGEGRVKLLDFGIAQLLEHEAADAQGLRLLTPDYAAPEQLRGEAITTATDVHALGVLLYELLTDSHPFAHGDGVTPAEIERRIREGEPERPSRRAPGRRIDRELDWIVANALAKDPARRYATVDALLRDLRDQLAGLPIAVGPKGWVYRLRKLAARNRSSVALATAALLALLASGAYYTARVGRERDRAREEAQRAEQISQLLVSLFEASDPYAPDAASSLSAEQILERGRARIETELATQPAVQAHLWTVLGGIHRKLGNLELADSLLTRGWQTRATYAPDDLEALAESEYALAQLHVDRSEYAKAQPLFEQAIDTVERLRGPEDLHLAAIKNQLGAMFYYTGEYDRAVRILREVLTTRERAGAQSELAYTQNDLGLALIELGNYARAESLLVEALERHRRFRGEQHPDVASTQNNIALTYDYRDEDEQAERWYRLSLDNYRASLGPDHPQVALIADNLGAMLSTHGHWERSEEYLSESARIRRKVFGEDSIPYAETLSNLGHLYVFQDDHARAEPVLTRAISIMERDPTTTFLLASAVHALGRTQDANGQLRAAERNYRRAFAIWHQALGDRHLRISRSLTAIGLNLERQNRYAEAESCLAAAQALQSELAESEPELQKLAEIQSSLARVRGRLAGG